MEGRGRSRANGLAASGLALFLGACGAVKLTTAGGIDETAVPGETSGASDGTPSGEGRPTSTVEGPPTTSVAKVALPPVCYVGLGYLKFTPSGDTATISFDGHGTGDCRWNGVSSYDCKWSYPAGDLGPADSGLLQVWPLEDGGFYSRWGSGNSYTKSEYCGVAGTTGTTVSASAPKNAGESCSFTADCAKELTCLDQKSGAASSGKKCTASAGTKCGANSDCNSDKLSCSSYVCK